MNFQDTLVEETLTPTKNQKGVQVKALVEKRVLECIDEALRELGESVAKTLYYYFEAEFNLDKSEILKSPRKFVKALNKIFGEKATRLIELLCIKRLKEAFKLEIDEDYSLINVIEILISE